MRSGKWSIILAGLRLSMSNFYIADTHFGHRNCVRFDDRPFRSIEEHDETLISNWNSVVQPRDDVFILGDFAYKNELPVSEYTKRLNGHLHLIRGNHDKRTEEYEKCFCTVEDIQIVGDVLDGEKRQIILCHYWMPFAPRRDQLMLHGHTHTTDDYVNEELLKYELEQKGYPYNAYNVGCMHLNYFPKTIDQIVHPWK